LDETVDREEDSESSMPCSLPGDMEAGRSKRQTKEVQQGPQDETNSGHNYSLFDALRETIYSEVATLIANNESRPHFLIELFRELQLLTTDYLRQRALYGIQDLVTRFLTEESLETDGAGFNPMNYQSWLGSTSEPTASESVVTSEGLSEGDENPFEQDNLGDTVIHFGDSLKHVRRLEESFNEADSTLVATPQTQETSIEVDSQQLDNEIKTVMMHVIPILKDNLHQACTAELLMTIQQPVVALVMATEKPQKEFVEILQRQLETSVAATLAKYQGKVLRDCGENLLVDLSEVLFNELGFFRVLQDMKVDPKTLVDASQEQPPRGTSHPTGTGVLATTMTAALHEEEEALGKVSTVFPT
jgi:pericentriolar material 1 protein